MRRPAGSAGRWKKQLADAKQAWPLLGIDELVATDGHVQKLAGLVQERYGLAHDVAEQQVLRFLGMPDQSGSP
ncbi:MAG: CsbD family protein [Rhizobium sp.]|nr:CsbD family protein [Rhizobium sp.]